MVEQYLDVQATILCCFLTSPVTCSVLRYLSHTRLRYYHLVFNKGFLILPWLESLGVFAARNSSVKRNRTSRCDIYSSCGGGVLEECSDWLAVARRCRESQHRGLTASGSPAQDRKAATFPGSRSCPIMHTAACPMSHILF
jgi:hypothetical protein